MVIVLSGGNVDPLLLERVIGHRLVASGGSLPVTVSFPDRPGSLAALLACVAGTGANVLEVLRDHRTCADLGVNEVEVSIDLGEARGPAHCDEIIGGLLTAAGYAVSY